MDPNDEDINEEQRHRDHLIHSSAADSNQVYESANLPELDPMLDLENDDEPSYTEIPTSQTEYSSRRRGRPCGGSSSSQQSKKKREMVDRLIDPIRELADAIKSSSDGSNDRKIAEEVNEALFEMYGHDSIDKMAAATIFLMKNKWAALSILSAPKERRVTLLDAIMRASTSNP